MFVVKWLMFKVSDLISRFQASLWILPDRAPYSLLIEPQKLNNLQPAYNLAHCLFSEGIRIAHISLTKFIYKLELLIQSSVIRQQ